jgi:hypothetical protein
MRINFKSILFITLLMCCLGTSANVVYQDNNRAFHSY